MLLQKTDEEWLAWERSDRSLDAIPVPEAWKGFEQTYQIQIQTAEFCEYVIWRKGQGRAVPEAALKALAEIAGMLVPTLLSEGRMLPEIPHQLIHVRACGGEYWLELANYEGEV